MFLNFTYKSSLVQNLRRVMPNLEKLLKNQELIAKELSSLKAEVNELENLYNKLKGCCGGNTVKSLDAENALLEKQINLTKNELIRLEIVRGVKQIPLPSRENVYTKVIDNTVDFANESAPSTVAIASDAAQTTENKPNTTEKKKKPDKKEKNKSDTGDQLEESPVDVSRLDMRVGKIVDVKRHPDADTLYVEQIDLGKDQPVTVISGLVKHVPLEEMQGRMVIVLCNLKPVKMRGIMSEGMVMCATTPEKTDILQPPKGAVPGDIVHVNGFPPNPDAVLNPKKKIFETVAPHLKTNSNFEATYNGHIWTIPGKGNIISNSLKDANIK